MPADPEDPGIGEVLLVVEELGTRRAEEMVGRLAHTAVFHPAETKTI